MAKLAGLHAEGVTDLDSYNLGVIAERERIIKDAEDAYPADVFLEPNWGQVRDALATIGVTLDSVAGSLLRRQIPAFIKGEE